MRYELTESTRRALFAEWRKVAPELDYPSVETDDEARHIFTKGVLGAAQDSWKRLTENQGKRLLKAMRERSGSAPNYRNLLIVKLAQDLFGPAWDRLLVERLSVRFKIRDLRELRPRDARAEIEELLSRISRRDGVSVDVVRNRFRSVA